VVGSLNSNEASPVEHLLELVLNVGSRLENPFRLAVTHSEAEALGGRLLGAETPTPSG
jgi:hypothetical protein